MSPETGTPTLETPGAPAPAAPAAPPGPSAEERIAIAKEYLREKHGIEDDDEIPVLRQRARRADELDQVVRTQYRPPVAPPAAPQAPAPVLSREEYAEIEQLGRINPVAAYARLNAIQESAREQREAERQRQQTAQTVSLITGMTTYQRTYEESDRWLRSELPEALDGKSKLAKEAARLWDAMPHLHRQGDAMATVAKLAAVNLGMLPKSKRQTVSEAARDTDEQAPERGARRPAQDPDGQPRPTDRQSKIAKEMGIDSKAVAKRSAELKAAKEKR